MIPVIEFGIVSVAVFTAFFVIMSILFTDR